MRRRDNDKTVILNIWPSRKDSWAILFAPLSEGSVAVHEVPDNWVFGHENCPKVLAALERVQSTHIGWDASRNQSCMSMTEKR